MTRPLALGCVDCGASPKAYKARTPKEWWVCRTCRATDSGWRLDHPDRRGQPRDEFDDWWTPRMSPRYDTLLFVAPERFDKPLVLVLEQEPALSTGYAPTSRDVAKSRRCSACHAPASAARPELVGASQLACPKCGAAASHWKKGVTVDSSLPADLRGRCKSEKQPKLSALEVRKKRAAAVERALQVARAERRVPVSDAIWTTTRFPTPAPMLTPAPQKRGPGRPRKDGFATGTRPPQRGPFDTENAPVRHWKSSSGKIAESQREAAEWQERYEFHAAGSNEGVAQVADHPHAWSAAESKQRAVRDVENAHAPRTELVAAARSGDEHAQWRATALFGDSWRLKISNRVAVGARE